MGFFETMKTGYSTMWNDAKMAWQNHGAQILTSGGSALMLLANGLFTRKAMKEETRQAIESANAVIAEIKNQPIVVTADISEKKAKNQKKFRLAKARGSKIITFGKHFWKEAAVSVTGAVMVGAGQHMNTTQKTLLASSVAAISAEFANYRANVVEDQGAEKDLAYFTEKFTGKKSQKKLKDGKNKDEKTEEAGDGITIQANQSAFKLYLSPETTPWIYHDNLTLTIENIKSIERQIELIGWKNGYVSLNDMRREFADMNNARMFDVGIGGIMGKTFEAYRGDDGHMKFPHYELGGWRDDIDFIEGRKVGVWVIFVCDPEPIVGVIDKKAIQRNMKG